MNKIPVTIIIPVYNGSLVLGDAVKDIFEQDYQQIELIAVNDGSTDESLNVLRELAKKAPEHVTVHIIDRENAGICAARNAGLEAATGDYVAFMDQDDRIPSDYVSNLMKAVDENTNAVIGGTVDYHPSSGKKHNRDLDPDAGWSMYRNTAPWGRLFRRSLLNEHNIRFAPTKISEDFYFNFLFLSYCGAGTVKIIEQSGYMWRIDENSESHKNMSQIAKDRDVTVILTKLLNDMREIDGSSVLTKDLFEYLMIKHIIWYLLFVSKGASRGDVKQVHDHVMTWLKENFPNYSRNPQLKISRPVGESFAIRFSVCLCVFLDKLGLLTATLRIYRL